MGSCCVFFFRYNDFDLKQRCLWLFRNVTHITLFWRECEACASFRQENQGSMRCVFCANAPLRCLQHHLPLHPPVATFSISPASLASRVRWPLDVFWAPRVPENTTRLDDVRQNLSRWNILWNYWPGLCRRLQCIALRVVENMRVRSSGIGIAGKYTWLSSFCKLSKLRRREHHNLMAPWTPRSPLWYPSSWVRVLKEIRSTIAGSRHQTRKYSRTNLSSCFSSLKFTIVAKSWAYDMASSLRVVYRACAPLPNTGANSAFVRRLRYKKVSSFVSYSMIG